VFCVTRMGPRVLTYSVVFTCILNFGKVPCETLLISFACQTNITLRHPSVLGPIGRDCLFPSCKVNNAYQMCFGPSARAMHRKNPTHKGGGAVNEGLPKLSDLQKMWGYKLKVFQTFLGNFRSLLQLVKDFNAFLVSFYYV